MATFVVTPHLLGVVIVPPGKSDKVGKLLIKGESFRGISFDQLTHIAATTRRVEIETRRVSRPLSV
jgi:hypothetical protein